MATPEVAPEATKAAPSAAPAPAKNAEFLEKLQKTKGDIGALKELISDATGDGLKAIGEYLAKEAPTTQEILDLMGLRLSTLKRLEKFQKEIGESVERNIAELGKRVEGARKEVVATVDQNPTVKEAVATATGGLSVVTGFFSGIGGSISKMWKDSTNYFTSAAKKPGVVQKVLYDSLSSIPAFFGIDELPGISTMVDFGRKASTELALTNTIDEMKSANPNLKLLSFNGKFTAGEWVAFKQLAKKNQGKAKDKEADFVSEALTLAQNFSVKFDAARKQQPASDEQPVMVSLSTLMNPEAGKTAPAEQSKNLMFAVEKNANWKGVTSAAVGPETSLKNGVLTVMNDREIDANGVPTAGSAAEKLLNLRPQLPNVANLTIAEKDPIILSWVGGTIGVTIPRTSNVNMENLRKLLKETPSSFSTIEIAPDNRYSDMQVVLRSNGSIVTLQMQNNDKVTEAIAEKKLSNVRLGSDNQRILTLKADGSDFMPESKTPIV